MKSLAERFHFLVRRVPNFFNRVVADGEPGQRQIIATPLSIHAWDGQGHVRLYPPYGRGGIYMRKEGVVRSPATV